MTPDPENSTSVSIRDELVLKWAGRAFKCLSIPMLLIMLVFGLPIIGGLVMSGIASYYDCPSSAGSIGTCYVMGKDLSELFNEYLISFYIAGVLNPMLALSGLEIYLGRTVVTAWLVAILMLYLIRSEMLVKVGRNKIPVNKPDDRRK